MAMSVLSKMTNINNSIDLVTIDKLAKLIERQDTQGIKIKEYELALMWEGLKKK